MTSNIKSGLHAAATIVRWAVLVIVFLYWAGTNRANIASTQVVHTTQLSDHESRLRDVERKYDRDVTKIKSDIEWIRGVLEVLKE